MVKLIESGPWNMVFSSDIKDVIIEARPTMGLNGLMIQYHLKKGLKYAVVGTVKLLVLIQHQQRTIGLNATMEMSNERYIRRL